MSRPEVASDNERFQMLAKESAALLGAVTLWDEYQTAQAALVEARAFLKESEGDEEMAAMAREEIAEGEATCEGLETKLMVRRGRFGRGGGQITRVAQIRATPSPPTTRSPGDAAAQRPPRREEHHVRDPRGDWRRRSQHLGG